MFKPKLQSHQGAANQRSSPVQADKYRAPLKSISNDNSNNSGRWDKTERMLFLQGLHRYGKKWKKISGMIPTRTAVQVKSHGQVVLKRMIQGEDVFAELDLFERFTNHDENLAPTPVNLNALSPASGRLEPEDFYAAQILVIMGK